jgi:RNA polymerase sigma factor, sigma-70 family
MAESFPYTRAQDNKRPAAAFDRPEPAGSQAQISWLEQNLLPHEREIRAWLRKKRVSDVEIDDIIQETYARIGTLDDLSVITSPKHYAFQVAHSILLNHLRRRAIVSITAEGDLDTLGVACDQASPEEEVAQREELTRVVDTIATLPQRTREVLLLRRVAGLSQRETADRLAIAEKTVEKHLARAALILMNQFGRGIKARERNRPDISDSND